MEAATPTSGPSALAAGALSRSLPATAAASPADFFTAAASPADFFTSGWTVLPPLTGLVWTGLDLSPPSTLRLPLLSASPVALAALPPPDAPIPAACSVLP